MLGGPLSHFRILEPIGEGGMGIVYRGVDLRLNRPVAIKLLPTEAGADPACCQALIEKHARHSAHAGSKSACYIAKQSLPGVTRREQFAFIVQAKTHEMWFRRVWQHEPGHPRNRDTSTDLEEEVSLDSFRKRHSPHEPNDC